jgi:hypothetical protein
MYAAHQRPRAEAREQSRAAHRIRPTRSRQRRAQCRRHACSDAPSLGKKRLDAPGPRMADRVGALRRSNVNRGLRMRQGASARAGARGLTREAAHPYNSSRDKGILCNMALASRRLGQGLDLGDFDAISEPFPCLFFRDASQERMLRSKKQEQKSPHERN